MDRKLSDHVPIIIAILIGIILVIDLINVFVIGGPSFFSLIFKTGTAASTSNPSNAGTFPANPAGGNTSADSHAGSAIFVPTKATPVPVVSYVSVVTPIQEETQDHPAYRVLATPTPTQETDVYALIYSNNLSYYRGEQPTALAFDVKEPPLVIDYRIIPMTEDESKLVINKTESAKKSGQTDQLVNTTFVSPQAAFTVTVYDRNTGRKVSQEGFGTSSGEVLGDVTDKTLIVREAGSYLIQFDGKYVDVQVDMQIKRKGNME